VNPGDRLGDFRVVRQLGEGGMGAVYLAQDERLERPVALKVIAPQLADDPEFQRRFESEARSAAAIDDPHAVPIFSAGSEDGRLFIAMRFVDGTDLRAVLAERGALEPAEAVAILADVASALDAAHAAGFVHRDVKPANILLAERLGKRTAFLTDFGLTKGLQAGGTQLTGTGQWIGTLDYVAPEQMTDGRVDARTDVYALGCVLHEALTGSVPFPGTDMQKMWGHVNEPLPALGRAESLEGVVAQATAKNPEDRFQSAGDLARAAAAAVSGEVGPVAEGSVATGAAAAGLTEAADPSSRTRTMKTPAQPTPGERPTMAMSAGAPRTVRRRQRGSSAWVAAAIGSSIVLAAGLIGAALVFSGGRDDEPAAAIPSTAESASAPAGGGESEGPATEEPAPAGTSSVAGSAAYSQAFYSIEIPADWEQEVSDEPSGNPPGAYLESVWRDPVEPNTSITVDAQTPAPATSALESAELVRAGTSQSDSYREIAFEPTSLAGLPAARWIFQIIGDDEVVDRRVDYFVNACDTGIAVLGSATPATFGSLATTFHEAAVSVAARCDG
jgi:serine/threonine-protein kinase